MSFVPSKVQIGYQKLPKKSRQKEQQISTQQRLLECEREREREREREDEDAFHHANCK